MLVIDEHGDRKWGKHTAYVGRQWLANIGKTESGVVSVSSLWEDEKTHWPVNFEPYAPSHHFAGGKGDPTFRTKLKIASQWVERALAEGTPFREVVAESFYGEEEGDKRSLSKLGVGCAMTLKPSHARWHKIGEIGTPWEAALAASEGWEDERCQGEWVKVVRHSRDGHEEEWWALEVDVGPYDLQRSRQAVVATTDAKELPDKATWYVVINLPHPDSSEWAKEEKSKKLEATGLAGIVRLYALRMWVGQSYK